MGEIGKFTDFVYLLLFLLSLYVFDITFLLEPQKSVNVPNIHSLSAISVSRTTRLRGQRLG